MLDIETVARLRDALVGVESAFPAARHDALWLRLRCEDTLCYSGELRRDSVRQLQSEIVQFEAEFPGTLPVDIVEEAEREPSIE